MWLDGSSARNTFNLITISTVATSGFEIAKAPRPCVWANLSGLSVKQAFGAKRKCAGQYLFGL